MHNRFAIKKLLKLGFEIFIKIMFAELKVLLNLRPQLAHGVIGNTPVFGTDIQGSSPCGPTLVGKMPSIFGGHFLF